ncbi:MAG TPA: hypothetical protein VMF61_08745 [Candidatus Acidoferrales bacterium]|nr:hypothetical protein [Candidatus Acidoferrales bacterium]
MKIFLSIAFVLIGCASTAVADTPAPERTLVYSFTYGVQGVLNEHNSMAYGETGHGTADYKGAINDYGVMTVQVLREQPDRGLIVTIVESGQNTRKADLGTCVVYGNTNVVCDSNVTNSEELTLLRFLGTTFVDPNQIDAKQHWVVDDSNSMVSVHADYTIASNHDGIMKINELRIVKQKTGEPTTTTVNSTLTYDYPKLIPTDIIENAETIQEEGPQGTMTSRYQTTLKLVSDSMAGKKP